MTEVLLTIAATTAVIDPPPEEEADNGDIFLPPPPPPPVINDIGEKKIRKRGPFGIFKTASLLFMRRSDQKKKSIVIQSSQHEEVSSMGGENWKKLVGSIRPLHIPTNTTPTTLSPSTTIENFEDLLPQSTLCSFPSPSMSQYASASNLQELDNNSSDDENDPDEVFDAIQGDEMIDSKAEEFIAQFYNQMKLQHIKP